MKIDCRNLSCPQPIVETKTLLKNFKKMKFRNCFKFYYFKNNVVKFLNSLNLNPIVDENAQEFCIKVQKRI